MAVESNSFTDLGGGGIEEEREKKENKKSTWVQAGRDQAKQ